MLQKRRQTIAVEASDLDSFDDNEFDDYAFDMLEVREHGKLRKALLIVAFVHLTLDGRRSKRGTRSESK